MCCRYSNILFLHRLFCILKFICITVSRANQVFSVAVDLIEQSLHMCLSYILAHPLTTTTLALPPSHCLYALHSTSHSPCCFTTELSKWWCPLLPVPSGVFLPDQAVHSTVTGPPRGKYGINLVSSHGYHSVNTSNFHKTFRNLIIFNPLATTSWNQPSGSKDSAKRCGS